MADQLSRIRQRQLSDVLSPVRENLPAAPSRGWLRAIREAYGMSLETFGSRMGVTRQGARRIELAETRGAVSVRKLREAADALECDLAIVLLPRGRLDEIVSRRALAVATADIAKVGHTMALEAQDVTLGAKAALIEELARELIADNDPRIWRP